MTYICYLPFRGELGWMITSHVKRFHNDPYHKKIVCIKPGFECLFPTADKFFYRWQDIQDKYKAGVIKPNEFELAELRANEEELDKQRIREDFGDDVVFVSASDITWDNRHVWKDAKFVPKYKYEVSLAHTDVVLCPRFREMDAYRNWKEEHWQKVLDSLTAQGLKVGICGAKDSTFHLEGAWTYSYIEGCGVDKDIQLMTKTKLVVGQESGLQYLAHLCQKPFFCIDYSHPESVLHQNPGVPFKHWNTGVVGECGKVWHDPDLLIQEITDFLKAV